MSIEVGVYRHYKGNDYYVLGLAQHGDEEIDEQFVIYLALYPKDGPRMFARPKSVFFSTATNADGQQVPRFVKVADAP